MNKELLQRASRMFNSVADLRTEEDQRINEWFKRTLASYDRCAVCDRTADNELHYVGTVDSHEFQAVAKAREAPSVASVSTLPDGEIPESTSLSAPADTKEQG